eukprot:2488721-Amphidinium_carterae.1
MRSSLRQPRQTASPRQRIGTLARTCALKSCRCCSDVLHERLDARLLMGWVKRWGQSPQFVGN